jgi:hypothetical protein
MKNDKSILFALFPVVLTFSLYLVFSERIATKPGDAGFWIILALGIAVGIAVGRLIPGFRAKKD